MSKTPVHELASTIEGLTEYSRRLCDTSFALQNTSRQLGTTCPEGCGKCCYTSQQHITVSLFEALPLACYLWENGTAEHVLMELESLDDNAPCHFFVTTGPEPTKGYCGIYPFRFLVCRIFNQAFRRRKDGSLELLACSLFKRSGSVGKPTDHPIVAAEFVDELVGLNPNLGSQTFPVNVAVRNAIEYVGMRLYLTANNDKREDEPNDDPTLPMKPCA